MLFDFKALLNLDEIIGKRLVTVFYYAGAAASAISVRVMFIAGIAKVAGGHVLAGLGLVLFCAPIGLLMLILLRILCELFVCAYEHCGKD